MTVMHPREIRTIMFAARKNNQTTLHIAKEFLKAIQHDKSEETFDTNARSLANFLMEYKEYWK